MYAFALALAVSLSAADAAPIVTEDVDLVAVAHLPDDVRLVFFFSRVQNSWTCLDHRWASPDMAPRISPEGVEMAWLDETSDPACYRVVRASAYLETFERESPLLERMGRPWFAGMLEPGLRNPPKAN